MKYIFERVRKTPFVTTIVLMMLSFSAISANAQIAVNPEFPNLVTIPSGNIPVAYTISNTSAVNTLGIEPLGSMLASDFIRIDLSCTTLLPNPCTVPDANAATVFTINLPITGRAGTSCAGTPFSVVVAGPPGSYFLDPAALVTIPPTQSCIIDFTVNAGSVPASDVDPAAGIQTYILASVNSSIILPPNFPIDGPLAEGSDITTVSVAPATVPTLTEWGMIIFVLLAGLSSIFYLKKYRRA